MNFSEIKNELKKEMYNVEEFEENFERINSNAFKIMSGELEAILNDPSLNERMSEQEITTSFFLTKISQIQTTVALSLIPEDPDLESINTEDN